MVERNAVQHIIGAFGRTTGIDDLELDQDGYCCLLIDQDLVINIELDEPGQRLLFYSVVGTPEAHRLPMLMQANYLGRGTGGATLGLQPDSGAAVLSREIPIAQLDVPDFSAALERFVNTTEEWVKRLREPAPMNDDGEFPPPHGGIRA